MRRWFLIGLLCLGMTSAVRAEVAVIVNEDNFENLNVSYIRNIYLGKSKTYPSGAPVMAVDLPLGEVVREQFLSKVLLRSESNLNAYWARMLFSSQARPPQMVASQQEAIAIVRNNKLAIAYVSPESVVDLPVRIVIIFK